MIGWLIALQAGLLLLCSFGWLGAWNAGLAPWLGRADGSPLVPPELMAGALILAALGTAGGLRLASPRVVRPLIAIAGVLLASAVGLLGLSLTVGEPGQPYLQVAGAPDLAGVAGGGLIIVAWWRGIAAGRTRVTLDQVEGEFRAAILALVTLFVINLVVPPASAVPAAALIGSLLIVTAAGLVALPLARISDLNARRHLDRPLSVSRPWLALLAGTVTGILGLAGLVAAIATFERIGKLTALLAGPLNAFAWLLLEVIALPVGYALDALIRWLQSLMNPQARALTFDPQTANWADQFRHQAQAGTGPPGTLLLVLKVLIGAVLVGVIIWILARAIFRATAWSSHDEIAEVRDSVWDWQEFSAALAGWLRAHFGRFRRPRLMMARPAGPPAWPVESPRDARAIYREFLRVAARWARQRRIDETPREYATAVEEWPAGKAGDAEITTITEAYSQTRYGEIVADPEVIRQAQQALEALQAKTGQGASAK